MKSKVFLLIRICLLLAATIIAGSLLFMGRSSTPAEQATVIIIDVQPDMLTPDIETKVPGDFITRLDASKKIIQRIVSEFPQRTFGLITYGSEITYLIPATIDSWTLLQYVTSLLAESNVESWTRKAGVDPAVGRSWGLAKRNAWLLESLKNKNIIVLWNIDVPRALEKNAQIISLANYKDFQPANSLIRQHVNLSTSQTKWLIVILCLLVILSL